ncbi:ATP-binding protein [Diaporthe australafricana]|uniref:ATP-binding protein n=1 Tax=Diaporthe australafricana TaxID=127596 RepID=A0ABR3W740_9PEZI
MQPCLNGGSLQVGRRRSLTNANANTYREYTEYRLGTLAYTPASSLTNHPLAPSFNSGFTSSYDPTDNSCRGPIHNIPSFGVPQFYPRDLKTRVDEYVVGQDRAKKTICSAIFNHYQNLRRRRHDQEQDTRLREKLQRQNHSRERDRLEPYRDPHPVEDEFPGHYESIQQSHRTTDAAAAAEFYIPEDPTIPHRTRIDKSNLLLIGPTGVGKTYILETLSKKLNVPFTICDCNSFTQAGYIGQDVESCIERLLIESNYDTRATENGIVVLDEFDKIARRETTNGRDVGGEGVQQALLKLVEGTKVTINVKDNKSPRSAAPITSNYGSGSSGLAPPTPPTSGRTDQYTIDTRNILFVFCGAFVGLEKHILARVSKPSLGFGAEIGGGRSSKKGNKTVLPREMYSHLPHQPLNATADEAGSAGFTPMDLTTPDDLQAFGFIPELIGRLHNIISLSPLSQDELFRILTVPRNGLVSQYTALFETYPSRLYFTRRALLAIAERALRNGTGARGLKMEMERVLAEPMYEAPVQHVLITEACVKGREKAGYWGRDGWLEVDRRIRAEDQPQEMDEATASTFEQYREAGQSGE